MLSRWDDVTSVDLHEVFHIDTETPEFWARPWWWARARILGLLDTDTRLTRLVTRSAKEA